VITIEAIEDSRSTHLRIRVLWEREREREQKNQTQSMGFTTVA